jgi:cAMP-dependent protein kinase regulator
LSVAEAAVLGTFMERHVAAAGEVIVHQGEAVDNLYLIAAGQAEARTGCRDEEQRVLTTLESGDYFGEIALITEEECTADIVAVTPTRLLRLPKNAYSRYLAPLVDVESQLMRAALSRSDKTHSAVNQTVGIRPVGQPGPRESFDPFLW